MAHYEGPGSPDDDRFERSDPISEEDILRQIEEVFSEDDSNAIEVPRSEAEEIKDFLVNFNIHGSEDPDIEDIDLVWRRLRGNTSLVKDFVYVIMSLKEALNHSTYPLAVSWDEILDYAGRLRSPEEIRPHLIAQTAPAIGRLGLDSFNYSDIALSESRNLRFRPDATRYVGWLVSQNFLGDLNERKREHIEKHQIDSFKISNLATVVTLAVADHIEKLEKTSLGYRAEYEMERDALENSHEQIIIAMRGIYRMCGVMFLNEGQPPKN